MAGEMEETYIRARQRYQITESAINQMVVARDLFPSEFDPNDLYEMMQMRDKSYKEMCLAARGAIQELESTAKWYKLRNDKSELQYELQELKRARTWRGRFRSLCTWLSGRFARWASVAPQDDLKE